MEQISGIIEVENFLRKNGLNKNKEFLINLKSMGFSDLKISELVNIDVNEIIDLRKRYNVFPSFKRVDTCSAEFSSETAYLYSSYELSDITECEANPSEKQKVVILGGGPNRIGQGIEFDYCCVHASYSLKKMGIESIMINCNPETVSTDYDTSDKLYLNRLLLKMFLISLIKNKKMEKYLV